MQYKELLEAACALGEPDSCNITRQGESPLSTHLDCEWSSFCRSEVNRAQEGCPAAKRG